MHRHILLGSLVAGSMLATAPTAHAAVAWVGDFETADLSQWTYLVNAEVDGMIYAYPQMEIVGEGLFAARIELHNEAVWPNGLKRVELQHRPEDARTAEGATTWFAWSFYLPEALPSEPSQQIGYWESNNSFQQVMSFQVSGQDISFATRRPMNVVQWQAGGVVTPGEWHRIAIGVTWSTNPGLGAVDVWFDGEQVLDQGPAQTLADNNPHFTQIGLLRDAIEFQDVPVIILDDAVEGDALEDVRADDIPTPGGEDSGSSDGGATTSGPGDTGGEGPLDSSGGGVEGTTGAPGSDGGLGTSGSSGTGDDGGAGGGDGGGCSCRSHGSPGTMSLMVLAALGLRRRRRRS